MVDWLEIMSAAIALLILTAQSPDAWMPTSVPSWEGPVTLTDTHTGVGYLEMTGYDHGAVSSIILILRSNDQTSSSHGPPAAALVLLALC